MGIALPWLLDLGVGSWNLQGLYCHCWKRQQCCLHLLVEGLAQQPEWPGQQPWSSQHSNDMSALRHLTATWFYRLGGFLAPKRVRASLLLCFASSVPCVLSKLLYTREHRSIRETIVSAPSLNLPQARPPFFFCDMGA